MPFPFNAYLLAFLGSFFTTLITLPRWRKWCLRVGLVDDPGHRKIHDAPVPLAGGLAVLTGLAAPLVAGALALKFGFLGVNTTAFLSYGLSRRAVELIAILFGALGMVTLGCWDDRHELRPASKFSGQCLIALLVAAAGVRVTLFVCSALFSYAITVPLILAVFKPLLILMVPLADLVWVVMLRWKSGRPFYIGDTNHLSHRLVRRGWSRAGAVLLIWLLAAVTGGLALL